MPGSDLEYTCPMHPEIVKKEPGSCPICGMSLEPRVKGASEEAGASELRDMNHRFWVGVILTIPILILNFFETLFVEYNGWIQAVLATPVILWSGKFIFVRALESIWHRHLNMFTLIGLGVGAAFIYSLIAAFFPLIFPLSFRGDLYFEAASVITVLVILGQILEMKARMKTGQAIRKLLSLAPTMARVVLEDRTEKEIPLEEVKKGDLLRVRPGERVPTDGIVLEGSGIVDESMITGEAIPVMKQPKDRVTGATINGGGSFIMRVEKVGNETLLARIVQMVREAQLSRAPIQKLADQVSSYFVPAVVIVALLSLIIWWLNHNPVYGLINAVAVLIIACPCALGLATPVSITVGVGRGALLGLLIKNAEALEIMAKVDTVVVDKTGTLTEGKPKLVNIIAFEKSENEILQLAASIEIASEHPLALPIVSAAKERGLSLLPVKDFQNIKGKGVIGRVEKGEVIVGNESLFQDLGIDVSKFLKETEDLRKRSETVFYVAHHRKLIGLLSVADPIKESTLEAIQMLHRDHIRIVMATGDHRLTAEAVARTLGIDAVEAEILPEDKNRIIRQLQLEGRVVAMAGDGINDAPALALANVGIAMAAGTDIAIESAGITLVKGDLRGIARAKRLSELTLRNIKQNLWFAFLYNALGVPVAAGMLYPFFGILISPIFASVAMTLSSLSVILNSLRLKNAKI